MKIRSYGFDNATDRQTERQTNKHRLKNKTYLIQWCIAKNIGGYMLETRHRAASAEGARIEGDMGFMGRGCPPPQPTKGSGGAS